jgi:hypothetical protein
MDTNLGSKIKNDAQFVITAQEIRKLMIRTHELWSKSGEKQGFKSEKVNISSANQQNRLASEVSITI